MNTKEGPYRSSGLGENISQMNFKEKKKKYEHYYSNPHRNFIPNPDKVKGNIPKWIERPGSGFSRISQFQNCICKERIDRFSSVIKKVAK